jgi:hypothetical protein
MELNDGPHSFRQRVTSCQLGLYPELPPMLDEWEPPPGFEDEGSE